MTKKKLLIATDSFLPRWDGIARFLIDLLPKLRDDFEITVLAPDFKGEEIEIDKVNIVRFALYNFSIGDYQPPKFNKEKVKRYVEDADLVFTQTLGPIGSSAIKIAHKLKKPVIAFIHSIEWELVTKSISHSKIFEHLSYYMIKRWTKNIYNKCNLIITPSDETSEILNSNGIKALKTVVHLGIDTHMFRPPEDKKKAKQAININPKQKVIGFVGRIGREKDLMTLYKAFLNVEKRKKNVKLLLIGKGLESQSNKFKKKENIIIVGSTKNVARYLQAMDIFVLPSLTETSSLSTMEAMSCALPVLVTKVGHLKYYIKEKENGLFFPKKNDTILALKLSWLLDNEYVRKVLGANARKTIERDYNCEKTINKIKFILEGF